ncbi:hypothetical protein H0W26_02290 [Candidatus Dependentiae bacterium]|nr:hypothetical protein [Candidatus Dependentiae bacterium]
MVNKMLFAFMLLVTPVVVCSDWLEDVVASYNKKGSFDRAAALSILEGYRKNDEKKRGELEQAAKLSETSGVMGTLRDGSYKAEIALLETQIESYKKISKVLQELGENKKDQDVFAAAIRKLSRYKKQLEELRSNYRTGAGTLDTVKIGTAIAAKETQLAAYSAYVKNILI